PSITGIPNQTTIEDTPVTASFTVGDLDTPAMSLTVSAASTNLTLLPLTNIVISGSASNRTVMMMPAADQAGTSLVTLTVSDGALTASTAFTLTVTSTNDLPT